MAGRDTNAGFRPVRVREHVYEMLQAFARSLEEEYGRLVQGEDENGRVSLGEAVETAILRAEKRKARSGSAKKRRSK